MRLSHELYRAIHAWGARDSTIQVLVISPKACCDLYKSRFLNPISQPETSLHLLPCFLLLDDPYRHPVNNIWSTLLPHLSAILSAPQDKQLKTFHGALLDSREMVLTDLPASGCTARGTVTIELTRSGSLPAWPRSTLSFSYQNSLRIRSQLPACVFSKISLLPSNLHTCSRYLPLTHHRAALTTTSFDHRNQCGLVNKRK